MKKKPIKTTVIISTLSVVFFLLYQVVKGMNHLERENIGLQVMGKTIDIKNEEICIIKKGVLDKYEVYLTGEAHGIKGNYMMMTYFTKFFIEQAGVKYILLEVAYSAGELLNKYFEEGNEIYLEEAIEGMKGSGAYNVEYKEYFKDIYAYNKSLDKDKKIKFIGIDVEHNKVAGIRILQSLLVETETPTEIEEVIEQIINYINRGNTQRNLFKQWETSLEKDKEIYKIYLGKDYFTFERIIINLAVNEKDSYDREAAIINNFNAAYEYFPYGKYFGQLGMFHTFLAEVHENMAKPFAAVLNDEHKALNNKVLSIGYYYSDCELFHPMSGSKKAWTTIEVPKNSRNEEFPMIVSTNSFFFKKKKELEKGSLIKSYYDLNQYIVIIQGSPAVTMLE
jgi:hypothetical protein